MSILDISVYITIAISYNLFVHHLATILYRNMNYKEKFDSTTTFIFIMGIIGIVISKLILKPEDIYSESVISMCLGLGGILLILTSVIVNWNEMSDDMRLIISTCIFIGLVWSFYTYYEKPKKQIKKTKVNKINKSNNKVNNIDTGLDENDVYLEDL